MNNAIKGQFLNKETLTNSNQITKNFNYITIKYYVIVKSKDVFEHIKSNPKDEILKPDPHASTRGHPGGGPPMVTGGHPMGINPLEPSRDKPFIEPSHHHHEPMSHHVHDRSGTKVKRSPPLGELDSGVASMSLEDPNGPPDFNKYQNLSKTAINQSNQSKTLQPNALSATQTQYDYDIEKSQTLPERSKSRPDRKKRYLPRNPSLNDSFERKPFRSQVCLTFISRVYAVKNSIVRAFTTDS